MASPANSGSSDLGGADNQSGDGTDDDGIDERFQQRNNTLGNRLVGTLPPSAQSTRNRYLLRSRDRALETDDHGTERTTGNAFTGKCTGKNIGDRLRNGAWTFMRMTMIANRQ